MSDLVGNHIVGFLMTQLILLNVGPDYYVILFYSDLYCINEYHLFLVLYGIYSGVMYVFYHYYKQVNYLQFPPLQVSVGLKKCKISEPPRGKTNNVVSEQVRHKPACTATEAC